MKVYCNGNLVEKESLTEVFEPGFLFGWGVFEPLRVYRGKISFLVEHLERLTKSLELLGIEKPDLDWEKAIRDLLFENSLEDAYLRLTAYKKRKGTGALIYVDKFSYYTAETYDKGFSAIISSHKRCSKNMFSKPKSLSYLQNRVSWLEAQKAKKDEALILNPQDFFVGGSRSNLFLVKDNQIFTPLLEDGAFEGITRKAVIDIARDIDLSIEEKQLKLEDVFNSDKAFITSSLMEVMPLAEVDDKKIGNGLPGSISLKLLSEYRKKL